MFSKEPTQVCGEVRMTRPLLQAIWNDLEQMHEFAHERVGFVYGRYHKADSGEPLILLYDYQSVADSDYLPSDEFGALIGQDVILSIMQRLRNKQGTGECALHVHIHEHYGQPGLSQPDKRSLPKLIPGFQRVEPSGAHGILILSRNHGITWVWLPGSSEPFIARAVVVSGTPLGVFHYTEVTNYERE